MSKGLDIVALLEWAERQKTFKQPKSKAGRRPKLDKDFDPIVYVEAKKAEVERWEKYLKDQEKLKKKDEPKKTDHTRTLTVIEWWIIGILSYPIVGPLYHMVVK